MQKKRVLIWFRQDLRLHDNPALTFATETGDVLPIYIHDDVNAKAKPIGGASGWWLHQSLQSLNKSLSSNLVLLKGDPLTIIPALVKELDFTHVVWNRCYEPWQIARDKQLKIMLNSKDVAVSSFNSHLLWEPWKILKKDDTPYKVFTPYYRRGCLSALAPRRPIPTVSNITYLRDTVKSLDLMAMKLLPKVRWYEPIAKIWQPGEDAAKEKLGLFIDRAAANYKRDRDRPNVRGTSRLSPHLHFGEISPNHIWHAMLGAFAPDTENAHLDCYLSELGWREFSYYLLYHFPDLPSKNFQAKFDRFQWSRDKKSLPAWQKGQTGYPIVDAGMRELWQTGYMHNRVRMIVGSFLVKNLLLDWRLGESWFWDCLVDADLASNAASWQWVAGSGADAAPYFRIFNPVTQGEKFDPDGEYVKRYCPELGKLPKRYIHKPWMADKAVLSDAGVSLGVDYPAPIVDLKASRQRALDRFTSLKAP